jgi:histidine triad (HIT) family protein
MPTIFSRIIAWEIPSYKVYEDDYIVAFLDIFPQQPWHTLIVPKKERDHFSDLEDPYYEAIFLEAKKLSKALQKVTKCKRVAAMFIGYEVPHVHYHLIPTNTIEEASFQKKPMASPEDLARMQEQIIQALT